MTGRGPDRDPRPNPNLRDRQGWRVPRAKTKSAIIYRLLVAGHSPAHIHTVVGGSVQNIYILIWKIKNPDNANKMATRRAERKREARV